MAVFFFANIRSSFFLILLGSILCQCKSHEVKKEAPEINEVLKNSDFMINLPEDHRSGANWQLQGDYNTTAIQQVSEVWHGNEKGIYFNLRALAVGQTTLVFVKRKYTDTIDNKVFIVKIIDF